MSDKGYKLITMLAVIMFASIALQVFMSAIIDDVLTKDEKRTKVEEPIVEIEFKKGKGLLLTEDDKRSYPTYTITTNEKTIIWSDLDADYTSQYVKIVESDDINKITYKINSDGDMFNQTIHLNDEGLKKYSKKYVQALGVNLEIEKIKKN